MKIYLFLMFMYSFEATSNLYNVRKIVRQLHQQFCTIVEVGEGFCSMFVEFRSNLQSSLSKEDSVAEVFLGICPCSTLNLWQYCNRQLFRARPQDCQFTLSAIYNSSARVHRRICDLTAMRMWNLQCNCSHEFAGKTLSPVIGFNTCSRSPLPQSICKPRNVCGIAKCTTKTLYGAHFVKCDPNCKGRQPFCEELKHATSRYRTINSVWSPWTRTFCNATTGFVQSESVCLDSITKAPAFDCLGPGMFCCPPNYPSCKCEVIVLDSVMKVQRSLFPCPIAKPEHSPHSFLQRFFTGFLNNYFLNFSELQSLNYLLDEICNRDYRYTRGVELNLTGHNRSTHTNNSKYIGSYVSTRLNQSSKHNQIKRSFKHDTQGYSSCWEPTHSFDVPSKDQLQHSKTQKKFNSDGLESKNEDPWNAGLLLDKEDVSFFNEQLRNSKVSNNKSGSGVLLSDNKTSFTGNGSNTGRNLSSIFNSLLACLDRNQMSNTGSFSVMPVLVGKNGRSVLNDEIPFTAKYENELKNNTQKNNSLISISDVAFAKELEDHNLYPQLIRNKVDTVTCSYLNFSKNEKKAEILKNGDTIMNALFQNGLQITIPSRQIVEIDVKKINECNTDNLNGLTSKYATSSNNNGSVYLHLKEQNENSSRNDGDTEEGKSFILPVQLDVLNMSNFSANKNNTIDVKYTY